MLDKLTANDFRPHLGSSFHVTVDGADEPLGLTLIEVSELGDEGGGPRQDPFSLVFRGPRDVYLPQQIYTIHNDEMGTLNIFLVPIRPDEQGMRVQAVFN